MQLKVDFILCQKRQNRTLINDLIAYTLIPDGLTVLHWLKLIINKCGQTLQRSVKCKHLANVQLKQRECIRDLYSTFPDMNILVVIYISFEMSSNFLSRLVITLNWLKPKTKPTEPSCPNPRYVSVH